MPRKSKPAFKVGQTVKVARFVPATVGKLCLTVGQWVEVAEARRQADGVRYQVRSQVGLLYWLYEGDLEALG